MIQKKSLKRYIDKRISRSITHGNEKALRDNRKCLDVSSEEKYRVLGLVGKLIDRSHLSVPFRLSLYHYLAKNLEDSNSSTDGLKKTAEYARQYVDKIKKFEPNADDDTKNRILHFAMGLNRLARMLVMKRSIDCAIARAVKRYTE